MTSKISPSMMCADYTDLPGTLRALERNGIEYLHIDIMDGRFVPNFTLGTDYCRFLKRNTSIPLDYHLMVEEPENKLDWFPIEAGDFVAVHYESTKHLQRVLARIREKGAKPMVAINPATPLCVLEEILCDVDGVLVMTVNPGFAGQKLVPATLKKIRRLRDWLDANGYEQVEIEVDGNVNFPNAALMKEAGANIFVAGTSSIFKADESMDVNIAKLREAVR
ncbi:MAG: ribulose-phosphate 3-epimerase [Clostridia bacterium]|nr:ribulose-phosphate 3-epimerase [Clostridia bacterium]